MEKNDIEHLKKALAETQAALSLATQHSETLHKFVECIARLEIWDYDKKNGEPYKECPEPADGFLDSHCTLMDCIEEARAITKISAENRDAPDENEESRPTDYPRQSA